MVTLEGSSKTQLWLPDNDKKKMDALKLVGESIDRALSESDLVIVNVGMQSFYASHACCLLFHRKYRQLKHRVYFFDSNNNTEIWKHVMFISGMHVTWYLDRLLATLQDEGYLRDVQDDFLQHEVTNFVYWPIDYMIMIPSAWTTEGALSVSDRKLEEMKFSGNVPTDMNIYMNTPNARRVTRYLKESEGVCVPLTLLLNIALICFGEKALSNKWWDHLYVRVTRQTRVGTGVEKEDYAYLNENGKLRKRIESRATIDLDEYRLTMDGQKESIWQIH